MQNTSLIATLPPQPISPNESLTEELDEDEAGSSESPFRFSFEASPLRRAACCSEVTFIDVVLMSSAGSVFQVHHMRKGGGGG